MDSHALKHLKDLKIIKNIKALNFAVDNIKIALGFRFTSFSQTLLNLALLDSRGNFSVTTGMNLWKSKSNSAFASLISFLLASLGLGANALHKIRCIWGFDALKTVFQMV